MGSLMDDSDNLETACILFNCPSCGEINIYDTQIPHDQDYDAREVPTGIAIEAFGAQVECGLCNEQSIVGGTHPINVTLNLYHIMKEEDK